MTWIKRIGAGLLVVFGVIVAVMTLGKIRIGSPRSVRLVDDAASLARRKRKEERDTEDREHADSLTAETVEGANDGETGIEFLRRVSRERNS